MDWLISVRESHESLGHGIEKCFCCLKLHLVLVRGLYILNLMYCIVNYIEILETRTELVC